MSLVGNTLVELGLVRARRHVHISTYLTYLTSGVLVSYPVLSPPKYTPKERKEAEKLLFFLLPWPYLWQFIQEQKRRRPVKWNLRTCPLPCKLCNSNLRHSPPLR